MRLLGKIFEIKEGKQGTNSEGVEEEEDVVVVVVVVVRRRFNIGSSFAVFDFEFGASITVAQK